MVVVAYEHRDGLLEVNWQAVIIEQDPVLERLAPALDLALGLRRGSVLARRASVGGGLWRSVRAICMLALCAAPGGQARW